MPVDFLTDEQAAAFGRFTGVPSREELDRAFLLDEADSALLGRRRGDHNRQGFCLQLTTLRFLGTFLPDPVDVPTAVLDYVAAQLEVADPSVVKRYLARRTTRFENAEIIAAARGYRAFGAAEAELTRWIEDLAWTTGDGPRALFDAATRWLLEHKVLLPGVSTLARLVAGVRDAALERLWSTLSGLPTPDQEAALVALLDVPDGDRYSPLDTLRSGPRTPSGLGMVKALHRVCELAGFGVGGIDLSSVPPRRVVELARYGMAAKAPLLRRHPPARRALLRAG